MKYNYRKVLGSEEAHHVVGGIILLTVGGLVGAALGLRVILGMVQAVPQEVSGQSSLKTVNGTGWPVETVNPQTVGLNQ